MGGWGGLAGGNDAARKTISSFFLCTQKAPHGSDLRLPPDLFVSTRPPSLQPHPHPSLGQVCPLPHLGFQTASRRPDALADEWRFRKGCRRPRRPCRRSRSGRFPPAPTLPTGNRKLIFLMPQSSARHWRAKTNRDAKPLRQRARACENKLVSCVYSGFPLSTEVVD